MVTVCAPLPVSLAPKEPNPENPKALTELLKCHTLTLEFEPSSLYPARREPSLSNANAKGFKEVGAAVVVVSARLSKEGVTFRSSATEKGVLKDADTRGDVNGDRLREPPGEFAASAIAAAAAAAAYSWSTSPAWGVGMISTDRRTGEFF
jgi:hypothetical protein